MERFTFYDFPMTQELQFFSVFPCGSRCAKVLTEPTLPPHALLPATADTFMGSLAKAAVTEEPR